MLDRVRKLLEPDVSLNAKLIGVSLFIGKAIESLLPRIESLESRQLQKGDKGDRGERGKQGEQGLQGIPGLDGAQGPEGKQGPAGRSGKIGKDGVSVVDAEIALDDHLVLKLSNDTIIDAGELPKAQGKLGAYVSGNAWQIIVSDTPPSGAQLNDLWLDIS
jgi:hypothetical protein